MNRSPFALLAPHSHMLDVWWMEKHDDIGSDEQTALACGHAETHATVPQVHGGLTVAVRTPGRTSAQADGIVTTTTGLLLSIRSADCQTFLAFDPDHGAVGLLHAGWRGLVAQAIPAFVETMRQSYGTDPAALIVCAAPSLCLACSEFTDPLRELAGLPTTFFHDRLADLRGIADAQWQAVGVSPARMERDARCTRCQPDRLWSYRGPDRSQVVASGKRNVLACCLRAH